MDEPSGREGLIQAMEAKGYTRDQVDGLLELMRSAFARRGWIPGQPLCASEISRQFHRFMDEDKEAG